MESLFITLHTLNLTLAVDLKEICYGIFIHFSDLTKLLLRQETKQ